MTYYPESSRLLNQELQRQERSASWLAQRLDVNPSTVARCLQAARCVRPTYSADEVEQQQIAAICRLVEGMPLAIELAAAWVNLLSVADILAAIRRSLRFLESDLRGVPVLPLRGSRLRSLHPRTVDTPS